MFFRIGWLLFFVGLMSVEGYAQTSSFLADGVQDFIRREQLVGRVDLKQGLVMESFAGGYLGMDSLLPGWGIHKGRILSKFLKKSSIKISSLPFSTTQQYSTHHPYSWNDGAMIPAAGYQTMLSGGIRLEAGRLSIQLKPEWVYAQNKAFETFPAEQYDNYWYKLYQQLNKIDLPEQFGTNKYQKFFPGQSGIRYRLGNYSAGLSTENIWWGPGRFNALVMSNNAPGFVHITFNTLKPVQTSAGSFEGQLIAGSLNSSGILPPYIYRVFNGERIYQPKREELRYITGMMLSWQPKWVKGLFIGFTKASYLYQSDISGIADILPLEGILTSATEKNNQKASLGSLFTRYVMPEERAELYFEFGRSDKPATLLNIIADNDYPRAYIAGFRKLFATKKQNRFIEVAGELTQMQLPTAELIQQAVSWYTHPFVRQGFTNQGQVMGAGIGLGSNSQLVDISWVSGFSKFGITFERIGRNKDFMYNAFPPVHDFTRHWTDLATTFHANWQQKQFLFSAGLVSMRSLYYQWVIFEGLPYYKNGYDVLNFQGRVSLAYRF